MDLDDFPTSPAKRQRTGSPEEKRSSPKDTEARIEFNGNDTSVVSESTVAVGHVPPNDTSVQVVGPESAGYAVSPLEDHGILDVLMQHVEAESILKAPTVSDTSEITQNDASGPPDLQRSFGETKEAGRRQEESISDNQAYALKDIEEKRAALNGTTISLNDIDSKAKEISVEGTAQSGSGDLPSETERPAQENIPPTAQNSVDGHSIHSASAPATRAEGVDSTFDPNTGPQEGAAEEVEWEVDSSPYSSDSDSDSSSDESSSEESDDDEDIDGDYAMLDPEEQARILMQGDAGSDNEDGKSREKGGANLRTTNEKIEEIIPKPDITVTEDMEIEELGSVDGSVESSVLLKAKITGEYQVLESGSLLCLKDRTVVGVVSETLGRVEQPFYTVRFTNDQAIEEAGLATVGTVICFVKQHSKFVFTQPLKGIKGSDASNFHDEEVGEDEMEFSDDEAEAAHKRSLKLRRQGRGDEGSKPRTLRGGRGGNRGFRQGGPTSRQDTNGTAYGNGSLEINYDDVNEADDDGYTPLARPSNLHEMMGSSDPREGAQLTHPLPSLPIINTGAYQSRSRDRGRGNRGRGHRGGRGSGFQHNKSHNNFANPQAQLPPIHHTGQPNYHVQPLGPPPPPPPPSSFSFPSQQYPHSSPPTAPILPPQSSPYQSTPFSPSPISPLPKQQYHFGGYNPSGPPQPQPISQHQHQQYGGFPSQSYNQHQNYQAYQQQNQGYNNNFNQSNQWTNNLNQAGAAEVQRQLDELSRRRHH